MNMMHLWHACVERNHDDLDSVAHVVAVGELLGTAMQHKTRLIVALASGVVLAYLLRHTMLKRSTPSKRSFGRLSSGKEAFLWTLSNQGGMQVDITDYGGTIVAIRVPNSAQALTDVVLGFDNVAGYEHCGGYFGCITGRCANRIAKGEFEIDGTQHRITVNNGPNSLHGGHKGFDKVFRAFCLVLNVDCVCAWVVLVAFDCSTILWCLQVHLLHLSEPTASKRPAG